MTVGERISQLRINKGFSINHLAELSGLSQSHLNAIEKGTKIPKTSTLENITDSLEISLHDFFEYTSDKDIRNSSFFEKYYKLSSKQKEALESLLDSIIE